MSDSTDTFRQQRARLHGIAYRMLGSRADAEDVLQEAWLRWHKADVDQVRSPQAWLTTTVTRLCIDRLRALRAEREAYRGPWLPEPLVDDTAPPADRDAELASDLSMAFLVVLERLAPEERAAFLLHDVFDCEYSDIARMLGRNEANCRQMIHRARERVRRDKPRFEVSEQAHRRLLQQFMEAMQAGDHDAMLRLFAADASWTADGGGKVPASSKIIVGRERIAKLMSGISRVLLRPRLDQFSFHLASVNGQTGVIAYLDGRPFWALSLETDGTRILAGYNVLNPDKLAHINPL